MNDSISLRRMDVGDVALVYQWRNDPRVRRSMLNSNPIAPKEHAAWFQSVSNDSLRHALLVCRNGIPFGFAQFQLLSCSTIADWGFYVDPDGPKGQGKLLGPAALAFGFDEIRLDRVCAQVLSSNTRSLIYHTRLGFIQEGVLREHHVTEQGRQDVYLFGILSREWTDHQERKIQ